jgi:hypothetical protein
VFALGSVFTVLLASMNGVITLGDVADDGMTTLEVVYRRCDRRRRLRVARLIAQHGCDIAATCAT